MNRTRITIAALVTLCLVPGFGSAAAASEPIDSLYDPAAVAVANEWGIPLDDAQYRVQQQPALEAITVALGQQYPDDFAGAYIDQQNSGTVHFQAKEWPTAMLMKLHLLMPQNIPSETDTVKFSLADLNRLWPDVTAALPVNVGIVTDVHIWDDTLRVALYNDASDRSQVRDALKAKFGAAVSFEETNPRLPAPSGAYLGSCSVPTETVIFTCIAPTRGGPRMFPATNHAAYCSIGFNVRSNSNSIPYVLTAGHCIQETGGNLVDWFAARPDGSTYPLGKSHSYIVSSASDSGIVQVNSELTFGAGRVAVAASTGGGHPTSVNDSYPISSTPGASGSLVGQYICKSGATGGTGCGRLQAVNHTSPDTGNTGFGELVFDQNANGIYYHYACAGDSGGPIFVSGVGYGITDEGQGPIVTDYNGQPCYGIDNYRSLNEALGQRNVHLVGP
ncbi:MAG: S1 family peptidase [Nakamurella sp.]